MTGDLLVAGVDSSTQATKVALCRAEDGAVVAEAAVPHPDGTECHPRHWWDALSQCCGLLEQASAVAVAAQQHGMIALDKRGEVIRPALLWNDTRSAADADALISELGGPGAWAELTGTVPKASFTISKLRWLAQHERGHAAKTETVLLPHDWLTWKLGSDGAVTDRGDASGTGYFSATRDEYVPGLFIAALGHDAGRPRIAKPAEIVGQTSWGAALAAGTGDNMASALSLDVQDGDVIISIGTSGTACHVSPTPVRDVTGAVDCFADATGRFLPLVATLNAGRILSSTAALLRCDLAELSDLALTAAAGADGLTLLPYLDGERTPNLPDAAGMLHGLTTRNMTAANLARAAVEGLLSHLANAAAHLGPARRILLIGGGARSAAVSQLSAHFFGCPVVLPEPADYAAVGAARQAAWALAGTAEPPAWPARSAREYSAEPPLPELADRYAEVRAVAHNLAHRTYGADHD